MTIRPVARLLVGLAFVASVGPRVISQGATWRVLTDSSPATRTASTVMVPCW